MGVIELDPDLVPVVETLEKSPERASLIRAYRYRVASVRSHLDRDTTVDIRRLWGLWEHLSAAAGWGGRLNHCVFLFELDGARHAVLFSDYFARFGNEDDIFERPSEQR